MFNDDVAAKCPDCGSADASYDSKKIRSQACAFEEALTVSPPFLMGRSHRIHAAVFNFIASVMPPIPMLGRSLL